MHCHLYFKICQQHFLLSFNLDSKIVIKETSLTIPSVRPKHFMKAEILKN